jgi:hypothetical protein
MKTNRRQALLLTCAFACAALPAHAADRMRAGQWDGTWTGAGRTRATSNCISQADADAMNGDVNSVRSYLQKIIPPEICKVTDIKVNGGQIIYTSVCNGGKQNVITTNYHGESFESVDTNGAKSEAKRVGACKS